MPAKAGIQFLLLGSGSPLSRGTSGAWENAMTTSNARSMLQRRFGSDEPHLDLPPDAPMSHALLAARGVVRSFSDAPVPYDLLHRLCALALCSPTKSDLQQRDIV